MTHSRQTIALSTTRRSAWFVQAERHPWAAAGLVIALAAVVAFTLAGGQTLLAGKSAASLRYGLGGGLAEGCPHLCVA